jgi:hypothetical protein
MSYGFDMCSSFASGTEVGLKLSSFIIKLFIFIHVDRDGCLWRKVEENGHHIFSSIVEQQDVRKEKAAAETIQALEDQYGDWHIAVGWRQQPNK